MMSDASTAESLTEDRHFRPQRWRFAIIFVIAAGTLGGIAWFAPVALLYAVPVFAVVLAVVAFAHAGLILTDEGIEWYALRPRWRFRKIPWHAVLEVKRSLFGLFGPIRLVVEFGRYEAWVWGTPRPGRRLDFEIWTRGLVGGEELLPAIQERLKARDEAAAPSAR
jgi:hypothetical protein